MWVAVDRLSPILLDAALAATALMSFIVLGLLLCPQPARRLVLARAAVLALLAMIPLAAAVPRPRVDPLGWLEAAQRVPRFAPALRTVSPGAPGKAVGPDLAAPQAAWSPGPDSGEPGPWRLGPWLARGFTAGYLAGLALALLWLLLGFWGVRRLVRRSWAPGPATRALWDATVLSFGGGRKPPRLRVAPRLKQPVAAGLLRRCVLIPPELDSPTVDSDSLRLILVHELVHDRQGDARLGVLASLAQCLWFFHPLVWWLRSRIRIDQEFLADRHTAAVAGSSADYARRLIGLASSSGAQTPPAVSGPSAPLLPGWWRNQGLESSLLQRIAMLLHCPYPVELRVPRSWGAAATTGVLVLAVLCSSVDFLRLDRTWTSPGRYMRHPNGLATFQVPQFVAAPRPGAPTSAYILPVKLPSRFWLTAQVQASESALSQMRLAGVSLALGAPATSGQPGERDDRESSPAWHSLALIRNSAGIRLEIDGRLEAVDPWAVTITEWLTIEPPASETVILRNLTLTW